VEIPAALDEYPPYRPPCQGVLPAGRVRGFKKCLSSQVGLPGRKTLSPPHPLYISYRDPGIGGEEKKKIQLKIRATA